MRIRSITYFVNPGWPVQLERIKEAGTFLNAARLAYTHAGYDVQTVRMATVPFPNLLEKVENGSAINLALDLEKVTLDQGIDYLSLGPALINNLDNYPHIVDMLAATQATFFSGSLGLPGEPISIPATQACAKVIQKASTISSDGFANLRFTALANVPHGSPFFPAAYHLGENASFAIATEAADLAVIAFTGTTSLNDSRQKLIWSVENHGTGLSNVANELSTQFDVSFGGIDFTLAPFPEEQRSLGAALERLGVPAVGLSGSLAAAAIMAECLDQAQYPRAGFSGLMFPILEDQVLAQRASQGNIHLNDLLLYSTVCGTGLDTVPLPGGTGWEQIAALLLDLATLAHRLDKPLTARLMPIPGKVAGDTTTFDFPYFANSRIIDISASALVGALASSESFVIQPRPKR